MNSACDVKYIGIFFGFLTGVVRNFSACLSKFDVFVRSWLACFEKVRVSYMQALTVFLINPLLYRFIIS